MPRVAEREYRALSLETGTEHRVSGYACTFEPYLLYSLDGVDYFERIDERAFDEADMSDVIMQYDHEGRVYARNSNGTLTLTVDERGLKIDADLSRSATARALHEEIKEELTTKMSWSFVTSEESYDSDTRTRTILKVKKVYDVSAVSYPANNDTEIYARSFVDGVIEKEKQELLERRRSIVKLKLALEMEGV